ncbi:MAG: tRNA (adenosine(37)-N6)-dimethylallyltransferase MiaA [Candidatus Dactylopiibacterium carminicum]|uniref:tRNA dimethylallyltransferase n=1 Tax=Candidatus Dactylopiibacterium carminicum TaxID=857335 RepID=A0A272ESX2_9RHOO|nr:tRNA (adenosine(37)-N6)-dimethylallyltransferase MiaA [Candidatus Dactylopiibacterium carminicum]KAF7598903.1 tRNA (adenosine(37)-N6)-dimethylallyltransferase MiaA [Candidatus Dactylopiibacterium carminicum]PAS92830.1 MAG: tRNA (adenosine(37)-N6)-dimethylallyltransferase MiaA [Candidatus Dactylopiibacterium carminicum]PAS96270.1 MAG: tRNA (adenosine(37)-N6)-dimethylallyltransferase MiaA [Candidatus Dactylopiibacterium carminicum]PAS98922.1 MAG: tRNA (adenosine(37)-N6)-dimethylallyltransferas
MGPTASGKTAAALALAERFPVEIISVDSALVYRDMDIGTAKPSATERACCPHHLIDIISPEEAYSAARFRADALPLIAGIQARGRLPLLVGGTMLYFKALREGLSDLPQADAALRQQIEEDAAHLGWPALHARLGSLDAEAAARLNPNDAQRIQRALEIVLLTGKALAESYAQREAPGPEIDYLSLALLPGERGVLHARIAERFEAMLADGLEDELRSLRQRYQLKPEMASMRCVGYRQMWDHLDGKTDRATMREQGIAATRQLAKRQITWLRQFGGQWPGFHGIDSLAPNVTEQLAQHLAQWRSMSQA